MTSTKKKFNSKVFIVAVILVIVLSWILSPLAAISASAVTITGSPTLFSGYGYGKTDEYIHNITRLDAPSEDAPSITILVHGQGGEASHWSNDVNYDFAYDSGIIRLLRFFVERVTALLGRQRRYKSSLVNFFHTSAPMPITFFRIYA